MWPTTQRGMPWTEHPPVRDAEDAAAFIVAMGACLFHRRRPGPIPALSDVLAPEFEGHPMVWKDILHETKRACFGTMIRGETSFLTPDLLPAVYRLQGRTADDYIEEYGGGHVPEPAVRVLRALAERGPLPTRVLKSATGLSGPREKARFNTAMTELRHTLTVTVGSAMSRTRAGYEYVWDLFDSAWPEVSQAARVRYPNRAEAITAVRHRCRAWLGEADDAAVARLFGWQAE
jgi:hypothetical protein